MDCSLPGSSVHGIFQARVLEWVASAFSVKMVHIKKKKKKANGNWDGQHKNFTVVHKKYKNTIIFKKFFYNAEDATWL